jgi:hypothetical protein
MDNQHKTTQIVILESIGECQNDRLIFFVSQSQERKIIIIKAKKQNKQTKK